MSWDSFACLAVSYIIASFAYVVLLGCESVPVGMEVFLIAFWCTRDIKKSVGRKSP